MTLKHVYPPGESEGKMFLEELKAFTAELFTTKIKWLLLFILINLLTMALIMVTFAIIDVYKWGQEITSASVLHSFYVSLIIPGLSLVFMAPVSILGLTGERVKRRQINILRQKFAELPEKHSRNAFVVGVGVAQAHQIITTICGVCDDAVRALETGRDVDDLSISPQMVWEGLGRLVTDAKKDLGVVATILSPEGVTLYTEYLNDLEMLVKLTKAGA